MSEQVRDPHAVVLEQWNDVMNERTEAAEAGSPTSPGSTRVVGARHSWKRIHGVGGRIFPSWADMDRGSRARVALEGPNG